MSLNLWLAGRAILTAAITLILLACVEPVNLSGFTEKVRTVNDGDNSGGDSGMEVFVLDYPPILELQKVIMGTWIPLEEGEKILCDSSMMLTIKVKNADDYDTNSIEWKCDNRMVNYGNDYNIKLGVDPFNGARLYPYYLTVEAKHDGWPYSTHVFIEVEI